MRTSHPKIIVVIWDPGINRFLIPPPPGLIYGSDHEISASGHLVSFVIIGSKAAAPTSEQGRPRHKNTRYKYKKIQRKSAKYRMKNNAQKLALIPVLVVHS